MTRFLTLALVALTLGACSTTKTVAETTPSTEPPPSPPTGVAQFDRIRVRAVESQATNGDPGLVVRNLTTETLHVRCRYSLDGMEQEWPTAELLEPRARITDTTWAVPESVKCEVR